MPKRTKVTSGSPVNHTQADARVHRRENCTGITRDGDHSYAQVNSRPLDHVVCKDSLREECFWDPKAGEYGEYVERKADVVTNARRNMNTLKIRSVTSAHIDPKPRKGGGDLAHPTLQVGVGRAPRRY